MTPGDPEEHKLAEQLKQLLLDDSVRMAALNCLYKLQLPQGYIGAGFVRNLVWDYLHSYESPTPLADVDVIYFAPKEHKCRQHAYEKQLKQMMPQLNWEVRNQALMHRKHGHAPYQSALDAIGYWTECETAIAVRLTPDHTIAEGEENLLSASLPNGISESIEIIAPFGLGSLFEGDITPNPNRESEPFRKRMADKNWLTLWPRLNVRWHN